MISVNDGGASYYKVDVVDSAGVKVTIRVEVDGKISISGALLDSAGVPGFDKTSIKSVILVVDDASVGGGNLVLQTVGLGYIPVIKPK